MYREKIRVIVCSFVKFIPRICADNRERLLEKSEDCQRLWPKRTLTMERFMKFVCLQEKYSDPNKEVYCNLSKTSYANKTISILTFT